MKYVKYISNTQIEFPPINKDGICNYNLDYKRLTADGYKEFVEVERPITNRFYHIEYENNANVISEIIVYDETQQEADQRVAREEKEAKTQEINSKINELNEMIINELRLGNTQNIEIYNEVIKGLEETRDNL